MTRGRPAPLHRNLRLGAVPTWGAAGLLAVLAAVMASGSALADDISGDGPPRPAPTTAEERLARFRELSPANDTDEVLSLGPEVLADLAGTSTAAVEAEVRADMGRALRAAERFADAAAELRASADLARAAGDVDIQAASLADLARVSFHIGAFERAIAACREALLLAGIGDDPDRSWTFLNIVAAVQLQRGEYAAAIETSARALEGREQAGDRRATAVLLNNIGVAHMYLGDHDQALGFFHRARMLKAELGETDGVADMLANIGDIKHLQGHDEEAVEIHREALALRESEGGERRIALSQRSLAAALHDAGRNHEALSHIEKALAIERRLDLRPEIAASLAIKAETLAALGRSEEAVSTATESLELARELGMKGREVVALDALIVALVAAGDSGAAVDYLARAREIERELLGDEIRSEFAEFQADFETREKGREIELLRKDNELKVLELRHQRLWRNSFLAGMALLLGIGAVGWQRFLAKRRELRVRRQADSALRASMERYRLLFERNLAGVFQTEPDGTILITNQTFASLLGYSDPDELSGRSIHSLAAEPEVCRRCLEALTVEPEVRNLELTMVARSGDLKEILLNAGRVTSTADAGEIIEGIAIDISERNRAEEDRRRLELQLQQSQRLESLGVLAGGIAHDFNNMLMAILSNISLAKRSAAADNEILRRLDEAEEVCLRATSLTQQLLTFSKGGRPILKTASMAGAVAEAASVAARGSNCRIDVRSAGDLWPANFDEGQIVQAVQNLIVNAAQSMSDGGPITVSVDNSHLVEGDVPTLEAGRYVRVDVEDHGVGIPDDQLDRIFDPFFSTKKGGSGLGLATAFSIVRSHGGAITARSEVGRGSKFSIFIPASDNDNLPIEADPGEDRRAQGRLLIMDDDEAVRTAAAELLEDIGYEVATAADGAEALVRYTEAMGAGRPFDAVVLDLTVPEGLGGRETMTRLLEVDPDVKAIVSSGYSTDPVMAHFRDHGFSGVAVKPYRLADLAETLRRAIGRAPLRRHTIDG